MATLFFTHYESPVGPLLLESDGDALTAIVFPKDGRRAAPPTDAQAHPGLFLETCTQLDAYFKGERRDFDLPLRPSGTPFQLKVWSLLRAIPYGQTISYGELARRCGNPNASRAVGAANGKNPLPIVVPCHRVVGKNGTLTGFGGGLDAKQKLLDLEKGQDPQTLLF